MVTETRHSNKAKSNKVAKPANSVRSAACLKPRKTAHATRPYKSWKNAHLCSTLQLGARGIRVYRNLPHVRRTRHQSKHDSILTRMLQFRGPSWVLRPLRSPMDSVRAMALKRVLEHCQHCGRLPGLTFQQNCKMLSHGQNGCRVSEPRECSLLRHRGAQMLA